jgi:hypothetical protein
MAFLSSYILMGRGSNLTLLFAFICLAVGVIPLWQFIRCIRAVRIIDKGLAPYKVVQQSSDESS